MIAVVSLGARFRSVSADEIDFKQQVEPIFAKHCFECHGEKKSESNFRLDRRASLLKGGDSGAPAIQPNAPEASPLIAKVKASGDERMPPEGDRLTAEEISILEQWIASGARMPDASPLDDPAKREHWAFKPPVRPEVPKIENDTWSKCDLDRFVLAKLYERGMKPSAEADKVTLLRRLSLDLIGLPPTVSEVQEFLNDTSPEAYERQVERLLRSPHYGERWARHWLDAARYADSDGYEKDKSRQVWFYRDWVIQSLNNDLGYDQFVIEQIAGDLLPEATQSQRVATGFLRNSMINEEGGIDPEQFRMEAMFDRMDAIGKSILGLTLACCQCHNHKFDPLSQEDYYRMFAYLNDTHESNITVYTPEEQMKRASIMSQTEAMEARLKETMPDWMERMAAWEASLPAQPVWEVIRPKPDDESDGGQKYNLLDDGSFLCQGYAPTHHTIRLKLDIKKRPITAFQLELLTDPNLPRNGPGRSVFGTGALTEFRVSAGSAKEPTKLESVKIAKATADANSERKPLDPIYDDRSTNKDGTKRERFTGPIEYAIDEINETAWSPDIGPGRRNQPWKAVFTAEKPIDHEEGTILEIQLSQEHGGWNSDDNQNHNLGRFRLSITSAQGAEVDPVPVRIREILQIPKELRSPAQLAAIFGYWRTTVPHWKAENDQIEAIWKTHPEGTTQLTLSAREKERTTFVLKRGDFLKPMKAVEPGSPDILQGIDPNAPKNRLTFARWLVNRQTPTTARAFVNRVWQAYFGFGIVGTSEDLGVQSESPINRELLDYLAVEFMDQNWKLKNLHRMIVTSATYRQDSKTTPEKLEKDPYNRYLSRGPRLRVEGEIIRDIALAASGLLTPTVGGPSVFPPAPEFLFQPPASYGPKIWNENKDGDRYRRALYTFRFRSVPYPMLQAFDTPNGDAACVKRTRSNTPMQALTALNEPIFMECSRALAQRTLSEGGDDDQSRLEYAFQRCLTRKPSAAERKLLSELLLKEEARFSAPDAEPWKIAANDPANPPPLAPAATPAKLAAWTVVSRALLNLDETITKE